MAAAAMAPLGAAAGHNSRRPRRRGKRKFAKARGVRRCEASSGVPESDDDAHATPSTDARGRSSPALLAAKAIAPPAFLGAALEYARSAVGLTEAKFHAEVLVPTLVGAVIFLAIPRACRLFWHMQERVFHTDFIGHFLPVRAFSSADRRLADKIKTRARESYTYDQSVAAALVGPLQLLVVANELTRLLMATGMSKTLHVTLIGTKGCFVSNFQLPWPVSVVACAWFARRVVKRVRRRLLAACAVVGGEARKLEPRIST